MFLYVEFPGLAEACAFGATMDSKSFPAALTGFWSTWMGDGLSTCGAALLTEALEVVPFKAWKGLMGDAVSLSTTRFGGECRLRLNQRARRGPSSPPPLART